MQETSSHLCTALLGSNAATSDITVSGRRTKVLPRSLFSRSDRDVIIAQGVPVNQAVCGHTAVCVSLQRPVGRCHVRFIESTNDQTVRCRNMS